MGYLFRDIDDGLMILAALGSSEVSVVGITTTFGNVSGERTAAKAAEILRMAGRMDIPVVPGASEAGIDSGGSFRRWWWLAGWWSLTGFLSKVHRET